jgi:8-amino-7-oxononanoate synthase
MKLDDQIAAELDAARSSGLYRSLRCIPADVIDLASNDYLGLARHPQVIEAACAATRTYGTGARASRLVCGNIDIHERLEQALAAFKGAEAALVFPSGYQCNVAVITALARDGDLVCCDKRNHASLIDACRLAESAGATVRYYNSPAKLRALMEAQYQYEHGTAQRRIIIISDAVYSMDGDVADVPALAALAVEFDALLLLDDAHGTGTLGHSGHGAVEYFRDLATHIQDSPLHDPRLALIQIGTLSKAIGSQGGFVIGSRRLIELLVNRARPFIYSTGLNPAACGAGLAALQVLEHEPERLQRLRFVHGHLVKELTALGYQAGSRPTPIIPVIVGEAERAVALSEALLDLGVWCPAIRPPTVPQGASRLRVAASAVLTDEEIDRALVAFATVRDVAGIQ